MPSYQYRKSHVGIRRSYDRLISTMGFPILVRRHLCIELGPCILCSTQLQAAWFFLCDRISLGRNELILSSHYQWLEVMCETVLGWLVQTVIVDLMKWPVVTALPILVYWRLSDRYSDKWTHEWGKVWWAFYRWQARGNGKKNNFYDMLIRNLCILLVFTPMEVLLFWG